MTLFMSLSAFESSGNGVSILESKKKERSSHIG